VYPFAAGQRRARASDQSSDTPRLFDRRKISNPNFCFVHLARRRQNNRTTSRPHFDRNPQKAPDFDQTAADKAKNRIKQALGEIGCDVFIETDR
jgi:hypothetical protein